MRLPKSVRGWCRDVSELSIFVEKGKVFFLTRPPKEVLEKLRELGLDFEGKVIYCG